MGGSYACASGWRREVNTEPMHTSIAQTSVHQPLCNSKLRLLAVTDLSIRQCSDPTGAAEPWFIRRSRSCFTLPRMQDWEIDFAWLRVRHFVKD